MHSKEMSLSSMFTQTRFDADFSILDTVQHTVYNTVHYSISLQLKASGPQLSRHWEEGQTCRGRAQNQTWPLSAPGSSLPACV